MGSNCQSMGEYVLLTEKQQQKWKKMYANDSF